MTAASVSGIHCLVIQLWRRARASQRARSSVSGIHCLVCKIQLKTRSCFAASAFFNLSAPAEARSFLEVSALFPRQDPVRTRFGKGDVWRIERIRNLYQYMLPWQPPYYTDQALSLQYPSAELSSVSRYVTSSANLDSASDSSHGESDNSAKEKNW